MYIKQQRWLTALLVTCLVAGATVGCSGDDEQATGGGGRTGVPTGPISEVTTVTTASGPVLSDEDGFILYLHAPESNGVSQCTDADCVELWPPVISSDPIATEGTDSSLFGFIERTEGTQLSYAGYPVYRFSGDALPGQIQGCGIAGRWWPIAPDGDPVRDC